MPVGQRVDLLVGRRDATYAVPAVYLGDEPGRALTASEREQVQRASAVVVEAMADGKVSERTLNEAVELLHRLSLETNGAPRFRLDSGQVLAGSELRYRAALR